jgi:predicted transcriptional regulator
MSKAQFITEVEAANINFTEEAAKYFEQLKSRKEKERPEITEKGKQVLEVLKDCEWKTNAEIAETLDWNGKSVSGTVRALINKGFAEQDKNGEQKTIYHITELGQSKING